ncbi:hypothetical protein B0H11DRAFT_2057029 [Mycena galericulata]|nr:hypothetical protein B0H11DRAFT_2057029 [Mycena galericulata]
MTDSYAKLYNALPLINEARDIFSANDHIIPQFWPLLRTFEGKFGVCLVHRHCTVLDEERMVADGPVTEPLVTDKCHPISWLKTGEPFEFSLQPTECPPDSLLAEFRQIVGGLSVLGIFYVPEEDRKCFRYGFEHTRGRKNIMRYEDVVITAWRLSGDNGGPQFYCNCCSPVNHTLTPVFPLPRPFPTANTLILMDEYDKQLTPTILDLTSKTLTAMQYCASLLPRMCVLVTQLDDCCVRWTRTKLDVPVDAIYTKETEILLESLTGTSGNIDNMYIDIASLASTLDRFKSHGVRLRGAEEVAITTQLHILHAQLALLSKQVSAVGTQMDRLPSVDPAATRLREWATQFAMISTLVFVLDGAVRSVLGISSGLIASLEEDTDLSAN